jgi:hypothetical protein
MTCPCADFYILRQSVINVNRSISYTIRKILFYFLICTIGGATAIAQEVLFFVQQYVKKNRMI